MKDIQPHRNGLILVSDAAAVAADDRQLRRDATLQRIRRGVYLPSSLLAEADADLRYDLRIAAALATRRSPAVVSHYSAARVHGLPLVEPWPGEVHVTVSPGSAMRSRNGLLVHRHELSSAEVAEIDGITVTGVLRTLIDLARTASFRDAVAALDAALHRGLASKTQLLEQLEASLAPGIVRARRAVDFADPLATLPGESLSRVLMHELRFPMPELQHEFLLPRGDRRFADFWWSDIRLVGEFDGRSKYFDPRYTQGRTSEEVFWQEKLRENELREHGTSLTRWTWTDLLEVWPFARRLEAAGLRRARPGRRK